MKLSFMKYFVVISLLAASCNIVSGQVARPDIENLVLSAIAKYNDGNYKEAERILSAVVEKDPCSDAAYFYLAQCSLLDSEPDAAEVYLRKAVELDGTNFWYRHRLASLYAATSRPELAIDMYEKLLEDFPKKSDIYLELVELYAAQKEVDKALATIDEIEKVFGVTESLAVYRFNLLRMTDRQDEAFKSLEAYNEKYSSPYVLSTLADWQISMYNDSTALAYYNEALDLDSDFAPAQLGKAEVLRMRRDYSGFFDMLNTFVKNETSAVSAKVDYLLAIVQRTDPKFLRAFIPQLDTAVNNLLALHPSDSLALETSGLWYYYSGRNDLAVGQFRKNADLFPGSLEANAGYVEFLMYAEKWDELSEAGRAAFKRFPKEPAFLEMASVGDFNLQRYDRVLEICDEVLAVAPSDSSHTLRAWSTKGDIYYKKGETKKAYKAYEKALKINPDYVYVLNNYAYYLSEEGRNLKKAYEMSSRTVEVEPENATYLDTFGWIIHLLGRPLEAKPFFKKAMLHGGKNSAVILDHYAEVLFALKEYDLAFVYWNLAKQKNVDGELEGLDEKVKQRKQSIGK